MAVVAAAGAAAVADGEMGEGKTTMTKDFLRTFSCALVTMALLGAIPNVSKAQDSDLEQYAASGAPPAFANQQEAIDALKGALAANDFDATARLLGLDPVKVKQFEGI